MTIKITYYKHENMIKLFFFEIYIFGLGDLQRHCVPLAGGHLIIIISTVLNIMKLKLYNIYKNTRKKEKKESGTQIRPKYKYFFAFLLIDNSCMRKSLFDSFI